MRPLVNVALGPYLSRQRRETQALLERTTRQPELFQEQTLRRIVEANASTTYGRDHGFPGINSIADFRSAVPINTYEEDRVREALIDLVFQDRHKEKPLYFWSRPTGLQKIVDPKEGVEQNPSTVGDTGGSAAGSNAPPHHRSGHIAAQRRRCQVRAGPPGAAPAAVLPSELTGYRLPTTLPGRLPRSQRRGPG